MVKYLLTGLKLLVLSLVALLVTLVYNFILILVSSLFMVGNKWVEVASSNPFFMIIAIILFVAYLFSLVYINGYLAQKLWKWK